MKPWPLVVASLVLAACADRVAGPTRAAPTPASIAALVVTEAPTDSNGIATYTAKLDASLARRAGAYTAHVEYDPSVVSYVGAGESTSGLAAQHADAGVLRVAGASLSGYSDGVLFSAKFRVARPSSTAELRLVIDELRDLSLADRLPAQLAARTALLRPWP